MKFLKGIFGVHETFSRKLKLRTCRIQIATQFGLNFTLKELEWQWNTLKSKGFKDNQIPELLVDRNSAETMRTLFDAVSNQRSRVMCEVTEIDELNRHNRKDQYLYIAVNLRLQKVQWPVPTTKLSASSCSFGFASRLTDFLPSIKNESTANASLMLYFDDSSYSKIDIHQAETEKLPERIGSGQTGLFSTITMNSLVKEKLLEQALELAQPDQYPGLVAVFAIPTAAFYIPKNMPFNSYEPVWRKRIEANEVEAYLFRRVDQDEAVAGAIQYLLPAYSGCPPYNLKCGYVFNNAH
jgi:hypothetical protein